MIGWVNDIPGAGRERGRFKLCGAAPDRRINPMSQETRDGRAWQPDFLVAIDAKTVSAAAAATKFVAARL